MHRSITLVAAALTLTSTGHAQQPTAASDARTGIAATWAEFIVHWKAGHAPQSVAAFFTDDAINMAPGTASDIGRAAIEKGLAAFLGANKVSDIHQTTDEVQVSGHTAYERGTFVQSVVPTQGQPSTQRSRYLAIWSRQADGKWKCARFMFNALPPQ